ncbi:MAG: hypothetical protein ACM32O_00250 [Clostridia bacterium]
MIYYLTWQEDDWLDEIIDRFPGVNAMVPNTKTLQMILEARTSNEINRSVIVVNVAFEPEQIESFLLKLSADSVLGKEPLFLVGASPAESAAWQAKYPQADVIAIDCHPFEFDYDSVLDRMEQKLGGA